VDEIVFFEIAEAHDLAAQQWMERDGLLPVALQPSIIE
jgi:hypothetical protein